jgi:hypothetical protein
LDQESSTSYVTNSSASSSSCPMGVIRSSTTSIDSGRDSFRGAAQLPYQQMHLAPTDDRVATNSFGVASSTCSAVSRGAPITHPRKSYHSSSSSSLEARGDLDSICALNVQQMIANKVPVSTSTSTSPLATVKSNNR